MAEQTERRQNRFFVNDSGSSRRPVDLAVTVAGLVVVLLSTIAAADGGGPLDAAVRQVADELPEWVASVFDAAYALGALYAAVAVVIAFATGVRRKRLPVTLLVAAAISVIGALLCSFLVGAGWPEFVPGPVDAATPDTFPTVRVAATTAVLFALRPWLVLAFRRLGLAVVVVQCLAAWIIGIAGPTDVIGALGLGIAAAGTALVLLGSPAGHPDLAQVRHSLASLGVPVDDLRFAEHQAWGTRLLHGVATTTGDAVVVKVYGRDATDAHRAERWWRSLVYRDQSAPDATRLQLVEHEALVTILAERAGVPVPSLVAAAAAHGDALVVFVEPPSPLGQATEIDEPTLRAIWASVFRLHGAGLVHGRLYLDRIGIDANGAAVLSDFSEGRIAATDNERAREVAILLIAQAVRVGADRATDAATRRARRRPGDDGPALPPVGGAPPSGAPRAAREGRHQGGRGGDRRPDRRTSAAAGTTGPAAVARPRADRTDPGGGVRAAHHPGRPRLGHGLRHLEQRRLGLGDRRSRDRAGHGGRRCHLHHVGGHHPAPAVADGPAAVRHQDPRPRGVGVRRPAGAEHLVPAQVRRRTRGGGHLRRPRRRRRVDLQRARRAARTAARRPGAERRALRARRPRQADRAARPRHPAVGARDRTGPEAAAQGAGSLPGARWTRCAWSPPARPVRC